MRSMRWALTGVVAILVSCGGGSSSSNGEVSSTTSDASSTSTVAGTEVVYKVGDTGPGGGIIVYVSEEGFSSAGSLDTDLGAMCLLDICNYIEAALNDLPESEWKDAMLAVQIYETSTAVDWILPTKDALNEFYKYSIMNSSSPNDTYWSLSYDFSRPDLVWAQMFTDPPTDGSTGETPVKGEQYQASKKGVTAFARPMRAF